MWHIRVGNYWTLVSDENCHSIPVIREWNPSSRSCSPSSSLPPASTPYISPTNSPQAHAASGQKSQASGHPQTIYTTSQFPVKHVTPRTVPRGHHRGPIRSQGDDRPADARWRWIWAIMGDSEDDSRRQISDDRVQSVDKIGAELYMCSLVNLHTGKMVHGLVSVR